MRVLSWRLRSSPTSFSARFITGNLRRSFKTALLVGCLTAGCTTSRKPEPIYVSKLSDAELNQAKRECAYEAEKATASVKPGYAYQPWLSVYVMCLDLKGVEVREHR